MPISAQLATETGWESVFYLFGQSLLITQRQIDKNYAVKCFCAGALGVLWHIVWIIFIRSAPHKDPFISKDELHYIQSKVSVEKVGKRVIPWKALLTSKPVYGITAAQFAVNWGFNTMIAQMPTFLSSQLTFFRLLNCLQLFFTAHSDILRYDLETSGALCAIPYLTMGVLASVAGYVADMLINQRVLTITQVIDLCITVRFAISLNFINFRLENILSAVRCSCKQFAW